MLTRSLLEETCSKIIYFCNKNSSRYGICIHSPVIKLGIQDNLLLSNNLLSLYAKCSGVGRARHLFDEMPHRDVVSWTCVLSAYVKDGSHHEALSLFASMKSSGTMPNEFTFSNVVRPCSALGNLAAAAIVHACIVKHGFESNPVISSCLIELYSKWGLLQEAVGVFNGVQNGDTVSWTAMISSLVEASNYAQALRLFIQMMEERVCPNEYTFVKLLGACCFLAIEYGRLVHAQLVVWGVQLNLVLKTALIHMYAKHQRMEDTLKVFRQTSEQDVQLWTTMITNFAQNLNFGWAISAFRHMVGENIVPNNYCYAAVLNVCASSQALQLGKQVHAQLMMAGLESDLYAGNALLDFYAKCSISAGDVVWVFKRIALPNIVSWSTLIAGLAAHNLKDKCFQAFVEMQLVGQQPNSFTLSSILQVCGTAQSAKEARMIHGFIIKTNADVDTIVGNALVDVYTGSHMVDCAINLAKGMKNRNVVTYTVLASKLNEIGCHDRTLGIINNVRSDGFLTDGFILSSFLSASANLGAIQIGKQIHCFSIASGFAQWISVSNGLVDLYGKCGRIPDAQKTFREIPNPDIVSWNGLMYSYALNGQTSSALSTLEDMMLAGSRPDSVTLSTVLFACNKDSLVDMGIEYFRTLRETYKIEPQINHYNLVVDLLGKAGRVEEAMSLVKLMPVSPNAVTYKKMLYACKLHGNVLLGEEVARKGIELNPADLEFYALLASIYDKAGWTDLGDNMCGQLSEGGCKKPTLVAFF